MAAPIPTLREIFAESADGGAATAWLLGTLRDLSRPLLWVQDRSARRHAGLPYRPGLPPGLALLHVLARRPADALFAMEEGLRCDAIGAVVGELTGDPAALDFTATRRLAVASERAGRPVWLLRHGGSASLSGARERMRIAAAPSTPHPWNGQAPGVARMEISLFRSRLRAPGRWVAADWGEDRDGRMPGQDGGGAGDTVDPAAAAGA